MEFLISFRAELRLCRGVKRLICACGDDTEIEEAGDADPRYVVEESMGTKATTGSDRPPHYRCAFNLGEHNQA